MATALLLLFSLALAVTAVRRWYLALCGLVVLAVFLQHPAMPRSAFGIQGLNPWNFSLLAVLAGWAVQRRRESPLPRPPVAVMALVGAYLLMLVATGIVAALDAEAVRGDYPLHGTAPGMLIQTVVNPFKYLVVGALIYVGANTRERVRLALVAAVGSAVLYAILQHVLLGVLELDYKQIRRVSDATIGLHPVSLAQIYCFGIWSAVALAILAPVRRERLSWSACVALLGPALIGTYSRNGTLSFCSIGIALGILRWRSLFLWVPLVVLAVQLGVPSAGERTLQGIAITREDRQGAASLSQAGNDWDKISSGRTSVIWPPVLAQILQSPIWGHGRFAILREPCYEAIAAGDADVPSHPHNAFLEVALDAGALGLAVCLALIVAFSRVGFGLIRQRGDPVVVATGFVAIVSLLSLCLAGLTNEGFYPQQDTLPNLVALAAACAVYRSRRAVGAPSEAAAQLSGPANAR